MEPYYPEEDDFGGAAESASIATDSSASDIASVSLPPRYLQSPKATFQSRRKRRPPKAATATSSSLGGCFACGTDPSLVLEPHVLHRMDHVVIIGAGAIGGFVGCCLYAARDDTQVTFLVRNPDHIDRYAKTGFAAHSTIDRGFRVSIPPHTVQRVFTTDPACLQDASCILVATKRLSNPTIHQRWLCHYHITCPVVFLQNGMAIRDDFLTGMTTVAGNVLESHYEVIESVVMMNVDFNPQTGIVTVGQPLADTLIVLDGKQPSSQAVCDLFHSSVIQVTAETTQRFINLQAAKIQLNMMNAINALSGLSIAETLHEYGYRLALSHCIDECRAVFAAHKIPLHPVGKEMSNLRLTYMSTLLRSWNVVFLPAMGSKLQLLQGKCSMAQDLDQGVRRTEIDFLNGAVVRLGKLGGVPTPVNAKIVDLVHRAEALQMGSPKMSPRVLLSELGLAKPLVVVSSDSPYHSGTGSCRGGVPTMLMSFDSLRDTLASSSTDSSSGITTANDPCYTATNTGSSSEYSTAARDQANSHDGMLPLTVLSSEDLTFLASPPQSPSTASSSPISTTTATAATMETVDVAAELMMSFDRSVRLWN